MVQVRRLLVAEKDMCFMTDIIFDEALYPIAWRLNSEDCRLSPDEKRKIVFLNGDESEKLWEQFFPFDMLMSIKSSQCRIIEKKELDFDEAEESAIFFREKLRDFSDILFFLGAEISGYRYFFGRFYKSMG